MVRSTHNKRAHLLARTNVLLFVSVASFDLVGWYKWELWSYVRLLHKPLCREREQDSVCLDVCVCVVSGGVLHCRKGDSHCTKSSLHYTSMYTHTTTTTKAFQSNMCLPGDNRNLLFTISYLGHMGFRSTRISCASAACLFQCVPVPPTSFLLRDRQQTMTVTVVGFQSNQSMRLIDNL